MSGHALTVGSDPDLDLDQNKNDDDELVPGKPRQPTSRRQPSAEIAPLREPFGSNIAPGAVARTEIQAELVHPHPAGTMANKRMLRTKLVVAGDYGRALSALRSGFLAKVRGFPPKLKGTKGAREERRLLAQIDGLAYPILDAAYQLGELRSSPSVSDEGLAKERGYVIALDSLQRRMRERSRAYYTFLENNQELPARLPGGEPVDLKRTHMHIIRSFAERHLDLRLKLDLSDDLGTTSLAGRTGRMAKTFNRDLKRVQQRVITRFKNDAHLLEVTRSGIAEKKKLPQRSIKLGQLSTEAEALSATMTLLRLRAPTLATLGLPAISRFLVEYQQWKDAVRRLEAQSKGASDKSIERADRAAEVAQTVGDMSRFLAEALLGLGVGKVATATFGIVLGAIDAKQKGKDLVPALIEDVVSRTTGQVLSPPVNGASSSLIKAMGLAPKLSERVAADVGKRIVRSIAGKTAASLAQGHGVEGSLRSAFTDTFTAKNLLMTSTKSVVSAKLPAELPKKGAP